MLKYKKLLLRAFNVQPCICQCNCSIVAFTNLHRENGNVEPPLESPNFEKEMPYMPTSKLKLRKYLNSEMHLYEMLPYIPAKYLKLKRKECIENLYLIDSKIAKDAISRILPIIRKNKEQIVCETNAGLGLIASELLDNGVPLVRLYEASPEFRAPLKVCRVL